MRDAPLEPDDTPQQIAGADKTFDGGETIVTDRLMLRPLTLEDAAWIGPESSKTTINHMTARIPAHNPPLFAELFILSMQAREIVRGDMVRAICETETDAAVGLAGLHPHAKGWELGYWICEAAWGQGYATEAARGLCAWAKDAGLTPLTSSHFVDNTASGHVLQKTGFKYTGDETILFSFGRMAKAQVRKMVMAG